MRLPNTDPADRGPNKFLAAFCVTVGTALLAFLLGLVIASLENPILRFATLAALPLLSGGLVILLQGYQRESSFGEFVITGLLSMALIFSFPVAWVLHDFTFAGFASLIFLFITFFLWFILMFIGLLCFYPIHIAYWDGRNAPRGFEVLFRSSNQ